MSLSQDGTVLAIGYPDGLSRVQVYRLTQEEEWELIGGTILDDDTRNREAGFALALSADGKTVAIGAPSLSRSGAGAVHVYRLVGETPDEVWTQLGETFSSTHPSSNQDLAGFAVDLPEDGNTVAIGVPYNQDLQGYAAVWRYNETSQIWNRLGDAITGNHGDETGYRVALSSDASILAVSDGGHRPYNSNRNGRVRVFAAPGSDGTNWTELSNDIIPGGNFADGSYGLGRSLGISSDGLK